MVLPAFFLGILDECRAILEVYPIVVLLAAHTVAHVLGMRRMSPVLLP
jgi:hypothetical protein